MRRLRTSTLVAVAALIAQLLVPSVATAAAPAATDGIVTQLKHLPGVTYLGANPNAPAGYRLFQLEITQPVDHNDPNGPTFEQQLELYHRDVAAPTVMYLSGYFNYTSLDPAFTYLSDPTRIIGGNQLSVEHRFFGKSVPSPANWSLLTVQQEAADEHHVLTSSSSCTQRGGWSAA